MGITRVINRGENKDIIDTLFAGIYMPWRK